MSLIEWLQISTAVLLIIFILLQQQGTTLGGAFGGESVIYRSRRGLEKFLFVGTIVLSLGFVILALLNVLY
ncbi:preprotein translocase subunit SecG [bacterium]|nr:preprotein translocase subunit SecG [bacterium]